MKKLLAALTAISLCFGLSVPVFATTTQDSPSNDTLSNKIDSEINILSRYGFDGTILSVFSVDENQAITYKYTLPGNICGFISLETDNSGNNTLYISEGDTHDILTFCTNGSVVLNGSKVLYTESILSKDTYACTTSLRSTSLISPLALQTSFSTSLPPGTSQSQFTLNKTLMQSVSNITFETRLYQAATGTVAATLVYFITLVHPYTGAITAAILSPWVADAKSLAATYAPNTKVMSYKIYRYAHPSNDSTGMYFMHKIQYWLDKNYQGSGNYYTYLYETRMTK